MAVMKMMICAVGLLLLVNVARAAEGRKLLRSAAEVLADLKEGKELPQAPGVHRAPPVSMGGGTGFIATVTEAQVEQRERVEEMNAPAAEPSAEPMTEPDVEAVDAEIASTTAEDVDEVPAEEDAPEDEGVPVDEVPAVEG